MSLLLLTNSSSANPAQEWIDAFARSDIDFLLSDSNAPGLDIAYVSATHYGNAEISAPGATTRPSYAQSNISQAIGAPVYIGRRNAVLVAEWTSWSRFSTSAPQIDSFSVISAGLPVGWLQQRNPKWQVAAFGLPLAHKASLENSGWSYEFMTGAFARYTQNSSTWWVFGAFADFAPGDDLVLPYVGAAVAINEKWTLNAIMPWPSLVYSPSADLAFRVGAWPSGSAWQLTTDNQDVNYNLGNL